VENEQQRFNKISADRVIRLILHGMKKQALIIFLVALMVFFSPALNAQCSICTKTAQQMGERPAKALNGGILYLAAMPFIIFGYIGYRWWRSNHEA
jgi:hypothetical protein